MLSRPTRRGRQELGAQAVAGGGSNYFGTTVWSPPGVPAGGITGMVPAPWDRSTAWMSGSAAAGA